MVFHHLGIFLNLPYVDLKGGIVFSLPPSLCTPLLLPLLLFLLLLPLSLSPKP